MHGDKRSWFCDRIHSEKTKLECLATCARHSSRKEVDRRRSELANGIASCSDCTGVDVQQDHARLIDNVADVVARAVGGRRDRDRHAPGRYVGDVVSSLQRLRRQVY